MANDKATSRRVVPLAIGGVVLAVAIVGIAAWSASRSIKGADDAFIDGDIVIVAAQTAGQVQRIDAADNVFVHQGDKLLELDTQDLQLSLDEASAGQNAAQAQRDALPAGAPGIRAADAAVRQSKARTDQVKLAMTRASPVAPIAGYVARRSVSAGDYVQPGQPLMAVIAPGVWVTANFKETDIARLKPGERADISVDAYPGLHLTGRVDSLQRAAGQAFSLLPAENASGNFVRMVQRVPVKITLDPPPAGYILGPGLSVHVKVHVG